MICVWGITMDVVLLQFGQWHFSFQDDLFCICHDVGIWRRGNSLEHHWQPSKLTRRNLLACWVMFKQWPLLVGAFANCMKMVKWLLVMPAWERYRHLSYRSPWFHMRYYFEFLAMTHFYDLQSWITLKARETVALGRELLGGNGILADFLVAKVFILCSQHKITFSLLPAKG